MAIKSFNTLIKLHKRRVDVIRREMQALEEERSQLLTVAQTLREELAHEMKLSITDAKIATFFGAYATRIHARQESIAREVKRLDEAIAEKVEAIRQQFAEQKKYEIAKAESLKMLALKDKQRQQSRFDEIGNQQFLKVKENPV